MELAVEFEDPMKRLPAEIRSKLLRKNSGLYNFVVNLRDEMDANIRTPRMPDREPHVELVDCNERDTDAAKLLVARAGLLEGARVRVPDGLTLLRGAVVLLVGGVVPGYSGIPHVTIHCYREVASSDAALVLLNTARKKAASMIGVKK